MTFEEATRIMQALANPKRLQIVDIVSTRELCAAEILRCFKVSQPTLSYDMKQLQAAGILCARRESKWVYYSLNEDKLKDFYDYMGEVFFDKDHCCCQEDGTRLC